MSEEEKGGNSQVIDEDNSVDSKIKDRILNNRERVDQAEEALFIEAPTNPGITLSRAQQVMTWGASVKRFLRSIEPLLKSKEVENSTPFYRQREIGTMVLAPPDTDGIPFSRIASMDMGDRRVRRVLGLPRGSKIPRPRTVTFTGLIEIIEAPETIREEWEVCIDNDGPPPEHDYAYPTVERPLDKRIYVDAVREADTFLQQAGIGLEIGHEQVDDKDTNPF